LNSKRFSNERKYSLSKINGEKIEGAGILAQSTDKPCLQTDKMMIKLSTILKESGGIGCSESRSNGVMKFSSASIHRLHEEFS
jgi:CRISPR/Cas system CSM-associated protein Csm3 (group 7 of RAMP superfamily)